MDEPLQNNGQSDASQTVNNDAPDNSNTVGAAVDAITQGIQGESYQTSPPLGDDNKGDKGELQPGVKDGAQDGDKVYNQSTGWRDYAGLSPEERNMFSTMSNKTYRYLYPIYLESRKWGTEKETLKQELEKLRSASFYEDENAYQVSPDYQSLNSVVQSLSGEASFWQNQLNAIESGQPYSVLVQDSQGKVQIHGPITEYAQGEARAQVLGALTKANTLYNTYSGQLSSFGEGYKAKYSGAKKSLQETESRIFAGADMKKLDAAADNKIKVFPSEIRSVPIRTLARALVIIDGLIAMNKRMQGNGVTQQIKNNISRAAGPVNGQFNTGTTKGGSVGSVIDEFKRAKAMGQI